MEWHVDKEMGILTLGRDRSHSIDNLQYFHSILDRHIRQMRDALRATKLQGAGGWPSASESERQKKALAADHLVIDYDGLLIRALELCERCTEGMGVMMNQAIVAESKRAIDQAERLKKLRFLASFFIPLSFTTSLFGANFSEFAPGNYLTYMGFLCCVYARRVTVLLLLYLEHRWMDWVGPKMGSKSSSKIEGAFCKFVLSSGRLLDRLHNIEVFKWVSGLRSSLIESNLRENK